MSWPVDTTHIVPAIGNSLDGLGTNRCARLLGQLHQINVALALPFQAAARLHPIEISVVVNLQQRRRMLGRPFRSPPAQRRQSPA